MKRRTLILIATFSFALGVCTAPAARSQSSAPRFDYQVRNDIFAGLAGNTEAMARGAATLNAVLREDPNHAEAMVWLGSVKAYESGQLFRKGDQQSGMALWNEGLALMSRAVVLAPDHVGVRIPRGATLAAATATPDMPPDFARPLVELALSDYTKAYELQRNRFDRLSVHARGELLMGIADLSERSGREWREWARRAVDELPKESPYARRAAAWLDKGELRPGARICLGCHSNGQ
jgi:hypothetical protein